jgi:hypothetical protein
MSNRYKHSEASIPRQGKRSPLNDIGWQTQTTSSPSVAGGRRGRIDLKGDTAESVLVDPLMKELASKGSLMPHGFKCSANGGVQTCERHQPGHHCCWNK